MENEKKNTFNKLKLCLEAKLTVKFSSQPPAQSYLFVKGEINKGGIAMSFNLQVNFSEEIIEWKR